jgi:hypothetical protein
MLKPQDLLDTSIAQIQTLAAFLREQLAEGDESEPKTADSRACSEILADLTVLMQRIRRRNEVRSGPLVLREARR